MKDNSALYLYAEALREQGFCRICGVDEAGRGPLAGPVCAAAVIAPKGYRLDGVTDSKKISEKKREELYEILIRDVAYGVAMADAAEIDRINILQATFRAMCEAVNKFPEAPDMVLVDGNRLPPQLALPAKAVVKGDSLVFEIAAASIIAKVTRDRYMRKLDAAHPEYGFAAHKGYGTAAHYEAIAAHGILPEHRRSFLKKQLGE